MRIRLAIAMVLAAATLPLMGSAQAAETDPLDSPRWEDMKKAFLGTAEARFDPRVQVQAPANAEDPMQVPITVDASAVPGVEEVVVFADFNPIVEALRFFPDKALPYLGFRIKLQQSSPVRAAARTHDGVWHVGGTWVNTVGGGCTAPSATGGSTAWQQRLNEVSGREWTEGQNASRLRLRIVHPMDTGLIAGTPAFHIEEIELKNGAGQRLMRVNTFQPVSENPVFTLKLEEAKGLVEVSGRDNNGNLFHSRITP